MDINKFVKFELTTVVVKLEARARIIRSDIKKVNKMNGDKMVFEIRIGSFWTDHGGENIDYQGMDVFPPEKSLKGAINKFKKVNPNESPSLKKITLRVVMSGGSVIDIPQKHWLELVENLMK